MQLGAITPGIIRTVRYFRGSSVIQNNKGEITVEVNPKGGITAIFEINYDTQRAKAAVSAARENDTDEQGRVLGFSKKEGRKICEARFDAGQVFEFDYNKDFSLLENLYGALNDRKLDGTLVNIERTVFQKMEEYAHQNYCASELLESI